MGVLDTEAFSSKLLQLVNIVGHLFLVSCLIVSLTNYWYQVEFDIAPATVSNPFSTGPFSCPTDIWEVYMFRGFCSQHKLVGAQRASEGNKACVSWHNKGSWKDFDRDNELSSNFKDSREVWMALAALMPFALCLVIITLVLTSFRAMYTSSTLTTWSLLIWFEFVVTFTAWVMVSTSDFMVENKFDGLPGCGNAFGHVGPGFIFAVLANMTTLALAILNGMAAGAMNYRYQDKTVRRIDEPRSTTAAPGTVRDDRQAQGYRPDIVA